MMPRSSDQLLLPVNPWFMWTTLVGALLLNLIPLGRQPAMPDLMALVLVFWNVHQPRRVGVGVAFFFGLLMDVHEGALLGQHALAFSALAFLGLQVHRRLLWFALPTQALHVLPLLFMSQVVMVLVRLMAGAEFPGWWMFFGAFVAALLWIPLHYVLLLPQYQPVSRDENRPI